MARLWRTSSSMSASSSRVAETLRFLAAASAIVASAWRLMAFRFSRSSFSSREVIGFLSGVKNEGVIVQQGDGIGSKFVQQRIAQPERRLRTTRRPLLTQDIGHVIGTESARRGSFFYSAGHIFRAVLPDQFRQFGDLAPERTIAVSHVAEIASTSDGEHSPSSESSNRRWA